MSDLNDHISTDPAAEAVVTHPKASSTAQPSKAATVTKLLSRAKGATIDEVRLATSWQPHSVRAHLSGLRKRGYVLIKERRKTGETGYRLITAKPAEADRGEA